MIGGWTARRGRPRRAHRRAARRRRTTSTARCATPGASAPASASTSSTASPACSRRSSARGSPFAARRRRRRAAPSSASRGSSPRSSSREWTEARQPAPALVQGPARGQAAEQVVRERSARCGRAGRRPTPSATRATAAAVATVPGRARSATVDRRRPQAEALEPRQGALSGGGLHQARGDRLLRGDRAGAAPAPRRSAADGHALPRRRRRQVVLREAVARAPAGLGADRDASPASASRSTTRSPRTCRRSCGSPTSPRSSCTCRSRAPRRSSARRRSSSTSTPASPATIVECCEVALRLHGMFENLGPAELREDLGVEGPAGVRAAQRRGRHLRADQAVRAGRRGAARARRTGARRLAHDEGAPRWARC